MLRLMGKLNDDGLVQRFLIAFVGPPSRGGDRPPNCKAKNAYLNAITTLAKTIPVDAEIYHFDNRAQRYRDQIASVATNMMMLPDTSPAFKGHLGKWEGIYARLALTFHMVGQVFGSQEACISERTAAMAAELMLRFFLPSAARFYSEIVGSGEHLANARWIAGHILAHQKESLTARDIYRAIHEFRDDRNKIASCMSTLESADWVAPELFDKLGPKKWKVNPAVHHRFADRARKEREARSKRVQRIKTAAAEIRRLNAEPLLTELN
jgi:hypothetical protein